jgi:transposase InsO family protein
LITWFFRTLELNQTASDKARIRALAGGLRTLTRRFVRRTINFSKKLDNHRHAVALFVAVFNFYRVHRSLNGKTPPMAARLTDHAWTIEELLSATF